MNKKQLADDYRNRGYWSNSTAKEIKADVSKLKYEIKTADKRTYNGKITKAFNNAKIAIAEIILEQIEKGCCTFVRAL